MGAPGVYYLETNYQFQHKFPGTPGDGTIYLFPPDPNRDL